MVSIRRKRRPYYIALGDSISTDDYPGEGKGAASLFYRNVNDLYPEFRNRDLLTQYPGIRLLYRAQDGATTSDILNDQLAELPKDSAQTIVSLTAGGNDILGLQSGPEEILFRLQNILRRMQQHFPDSIILLGTIYDPTDGEGDLFDPANKMGVEMESLSLVNEGIRGMARDPNIRVVEIQRHFLGHGAYSRDPKNNHYHPEDPSLWYLLDIEPNARGAHEIRRLFWEALRP